MAKKSHHRAGINPAPSLLESSRATVSVARSVPSSATAVGIAVGSKGAVPRQIGLDRDALAAAGIITAGAERSMY